MTETTTETEQEPTQQQILRKHIEDAADRYIAAFETIGKKWAQENDKQFGPLPTEVKAAIVSQGCHLLGTAIRPRLIPGRGRE